MIRATAEADRWDDASGASVVGGPQGKLWNLDLHSPIRTYLESGRFWVFEMDSKPGASHGATPAAQDPTPETVEEFSDPEEDDLDDLDGEHSIDLGALC